jgi:hypothetical protein
MASMALKLSGGWLETEIEEFLFEVLHLLLQLFDWKSA